MECELAQQKIALFAYGELPDDQCHALEGHLVTCKHCQEEFPVIAKRISSVESSVRVGAPETDYFNKFIELSAPVWLPKYGDVSNWPAYKKKVPRWSTQLEGLISSLYRATWSKQGMTPGFAGRDLSKILRQVNAMFARPRN